MITMTKNEAEAYARDGYILRKGLLSQEEVTRFRDRAREQLEQENHQGGVMAKGHVEPKVSGRSVFLLLQATATHR